MTWYSGTCSNNGYELTIHVSFMVKCMCVCVICGLWIQWFRDYGAAIPNS
jgi:hypothetical protein